MVGTDEGGGLGGLFLLLFMLSALPTDTYY